MNNVWVGTDWHLWSVNNVTDKRHQFRSISNLGRLSDAYAEDIQSDDIFIYLGDLCDPSVTDIKKLKAIVSSIPGYKVLCRGNHDTQDDTFYKEIGFDVVCEICVIHNLVFSHKPVRVPMGYLNIHGHLHTEKMSTLGYQHINAYDSNFFERPMLVDDLIDSAAFQSPEEYAGTDLKHVEEKFEKYTSVENDTYTQIVDLTDMVGLYPVDEAVELPTFKTPEELSKWMKSNIHYSNFTKLKSSDGVVESKSGSCHDQVVFEYNALKNMGKKPKILFFIAYREGSNQGGMTHSLVYYSEGNKVKWFENSWSGMEGIHTYDSLSDLKADIRKMYSNMPDAKNFPELEFKSVSISDFDTGMNLGEFVSGIMDETANDPLDEVLFSDITDVQYWENDDDAPKKKKVKQSPLDTDNQGVVAESVNSQLLNLFFISSEEDLHETEMTPRIPKNYMTENGYEDNKTPRISFSTSIDGCLMGLGKNVSNQVFYVYQPVGKYKVITPTIDQVPDVKITKERWICEPVKLVRVGKIRAIDENGPHDDGIPYTYGKNGEHEAKLYHWGWKWIKQFEYDLNESATFSQVKRIVNNIPKEEHHWFYHGDEFKDSPYVKYRDVMYLKNGRGKTIGGFIDVYSFDSDPDTGIVVIALEPGARGTGLATKLVQKALKKLPSLGIKKVIWRADVDNIASQKLAKKLGFTDISDLKANPDQYKYEYVLNEMYLNSLSAAVEDATELHEMSPKDKQAIANKYGLRTPGEYQQDGQDKTQERVNQRREKQLKDLKKARKIKKRKAFVRKVKSHLPGAQNESAMGILSMPKVVSSPPFDIDDKVDLYVGLANKKINEYGKTAKNIPVPKRKFKKNPNKNRAVPDYYLKLWFNPDRASNLLINDAAPIQHTIWLYPDEYCTLMFVCADGVCRVYMLDSYIAGDYHQFLGSFQVDMGIGARLKAALKEDSSGVDDSESDHYEADATDRDPLWGDRNHFFKHPNAMDQDYDKSIQESSSTKIAGSNLTVRKTDTTNPNDSVSSKAVKLNFYDGKDRVGTAGVSGYDTRKGFLYDLEVMKKYRGKGYGKRILDYVIKNYSVTDLSVAADNDVAINMYKKAGFRIKKTFDSNGENGYEKGKFHWMQRGSGGSLSESFASRDPDIDTSITENYKFKLINPTMFMDSINEDSGGDNSTFNKIKAFNMSLTYNFRYGLRINGIYDPDRNTTADDWDRYYQYQRPHDFSKSKVGTCWDYVGYESWYFSRNFQNVQYNTYCIIFRDGITDPSHTFLIFQLNGNYYYFESSFKKNAGIYVGQNENELIEHVISMMVEHYPSPGVNPEEVIRSGKCKVYQYNANDPRFYKIKGAEQYLSFIEKNGEEVSIQYKPNKKSDVVLVHSGTLYHGSLNKHSILKPKSKIDGKNLLFASPRYEFALAYAGRQWNDLDINQSVVNDQLILVEIYPGAFKDIFHTSGYIYEVPDDTFQKVSSSEYISEVDVVPTKTRRVQNVLVELEKTNVQLYYYPDLPPYIPSRYEYVKARCDQYGIDFKKIQNDLYRKGATDIIAPIQENYKFELVDKNLRFVDRLDEAATKNQKLYPVYVVLVHSGTGVSKAIKAISHSEYSHASICFDSSLDKMYSFARKDPRNPFIGGFRYESIGKGFYEQKEIPYAVYVVPCTESQVKKMKKRLNYFIQNQEKFTFDFTGLVTNYLGIVNNPAHRWFCSRFVADVLNAGAPKNNPYVAEPSLQDPDDFKDTDWAIYVDSGENLMKYDRKKVDRKTNQIIRKEMLRRMTVNESAIFDLDAFNPFIESTLNYQFAMMDETAVDDFVRYLKSFKVKFDKDGNVIISRREVDQLDKHFRQSLRMIKAYENAGDLDSVKLELCKINYMIELINEYYLSPKAMKSKRVKADLRKEMLDLRSVMLNAFSQHLKYVKTMDPTFNFKLYYDTSIYGKNIEIPKPVLSAIGKAIVTQL